MSFTGSSPLTGSFKGQPLTESEAFRTKLVHRLQRERRLSCGWVATGGDDEFDAQVETQRSKVDELVHGALLRVQLEEIRSEASQSVSLAREKHKLLKHRLELNAELEKRDTSTEGAVDTERWLGSLGNENVLTKLPLTIHAALNHVGALKAALGRAGADPNARDPDGDRCPLHWAVARGNTKCALALLKAGANPCLCEASSGLDCPALAEARRHVGLAEILRDWAASRPNGALEEVSSDNIPQQPLDSAQFESEVEGYYTASAEAFYTTFAAFNQLIRDLLETSASTLDTEHALRADDGAGEVFVLDDSSGEVYALFARLKESTSIQLAFLCGALSLSRHAVGLLPSRAYADLVVTLQLQRSDEVLVRERAPPRQLELMQAGFEYAPELRQVQDALLDDFTLRKLRGLQLGVKGALALFSNHIDKLEQLQVLHLQEVSRLSEQQRRVQGDAAEAVAHALLALAEKDKGDDEAVALKAALAEAKERIRELPAEVIKQEIERRLEARNRELGEKHCKSEQGGGRPSAGWGQSSVSQPTGASVLERAGALPPDAVGGGSCVQALQLPTLPLAQTQENSRLLTSRSPMRSKLRSPAFTPDDQVHPESAIACEVSVQGVGASERSGRFGLELGLDGGRLRGVSSLEQLCELIPHNVRISLDALSLQRRLSAGSAGVAYLARYNDTDVVVKFAHGSAGLQDWQREVLAFAQLRHPNVVRCLGVIVSSPSYGIITEYCGGGDLSTAVSGPTPPGFLLGAAHDIAAGMAHLHGQNLLHRDLKGANVFFTSAPQSRKSSPLNVAAQRGARPWEGRAKVADFGLSAAAPEDTKVGGCLTAETGTYRWMAPEVICHELYSKSADVFSFSCVLFELLCHEVPFDDRVQLQAAVAVGLNDQRPPLPDDTPRAIRQLIKSCWLREATARPSFAALHSQLVWPGGALFSQLTQAELAWLDAPSGHPVYKPANPTAPARVRGQKTQQTGWSWLKAKLTSDKPSGRARLAEESGGSATASMSKTAPLAPQLRVGSMYPLYE